MAKYKKASSPHFDPKKHLKKIGLANQTTSKWPWSGPYELGRRISFCTASRTIISGLRSSQECQQ